MKFKNNITRLQMKNLSIELSIQKSKILLRTKTSKQVSNKIPEYFTFSTRKKI